MQAGAQQIPQLLRAFNLTDAAAAASPEIDELAEVLGGDYREAPGLPSPEMARELARIAKGGVDPRRKAWRKWRTAEDYRVRMRGFDPEEIAVHAAPYTRGAGLLLWGFSCDARIGEDGAFVIFLNTAHQPGAVAATVAHELGHYIHRSMVGDDCDTLAPLAANFASHLEESAELFADALAAFSAYGIEGPGVVRPGNGSLDEIIHAVNSIDPEYRIDFAHPAVTPAWGIRYLTATIHFSKLRQALRATAGV
jgi:hypothetical protein